MFALDKATNGQTDVEHEMWFSRRIINGVVHGRRDEQSVKKNKKTPVLIVKKIKK